MLTIMTHPLRSFPRPQRVVARFAQAVALAVAALPGSLVQAQELAPHVARYEVRLGTSPGAPKIGTAEQRLTRDCQTWRIQRDVLADITIASGLRLPIESRLKGEETRAAGRFTYSLVRQNYGTRQDITGTVERRRDGGGKAVVQYPSGPATRELPPNTSLPIAGLAQAIGRLRQGTSSFPVTLFDAETIGDAMLIDVAAVPAASLRGRLSPGPAALPEGDAWPVSLTFMRARNTNAAPVFTATGLLHESGAVDRLTVRSALITAAADLVSWEPIDAPVCPRS
jgi:hypothetical protein